MGQVQIWQDFSLSTKYYAILMTFETFFLIRFVSEMNNNSPRVKMANIWFYFVNAKAIGHIQQRNIHQQELISLRYISYYENISAVLLEKHFKNICFTLSRKITLWRRASIYKKPFSLFSKNPGLKKSLTLKVH